MPHRSIVSWTAIINAYSNFGTDHDALSILSSFFASGVPPNQATFVYIFNLCANRSYYDLGNQIISSNLILDTSLSYFYSQCGDFSSAFRVFDRMKVRDVVSWTTIITSCSQQGYAKHAISLFSQMLLDRCSPNEHTVSSVLKAVGEEKELSFWRQLHALIAKKSIRNDVFIGTSLVGMYSRCGEIGDARKVFDRMIKRNMVTWTSIITGYARSGLGYEVLNLFCLMKRRKVVSWSSMIVGYAKNGYCHEALKLMYQMQTEGIEVDDYLITTVLSACSDVEWNMDLSSQLCLQPS